MNPELVLVVSDMFVPLRAKEVPEQFKTVLAPNKIQHVLTLGNIGSNESYDWLKSLSNDFHSVKGNFDTHDLPETQTVQIGEFKIGMIHGHQILPWGNLNSLSSIQRELGCDILCYGQTHKLSIQCQDKICYVNPGSISGAFSYSSPISLPSFVLMVIQGEEVIFYTYVLNDKSGNFTVNKYDYIKGSDEVKLVVEEPQQEEGESAKAQGEGEEVEA